MKHTQSEKRSQKTGLPPGTLVHVGENRTGKVKMTVIDYDSTRLEETELATIQDAFSFKDKSSITWINVDGIHNVEIVEQIGKHFGLHPLTMEDIVNTKQRPKMEDMDNHLFFVLRMPYYAQKGGRIRTEQVSVILTSNCVISFQEREGDVFDSIRERLRNDKGRIRKMGADYLAYSLLDAIVDSCFAILETVGEKVEVLEENIVAEPKPETLKTIHALKRELILLRKSIWPLREVVSAMTRGESDLVQESTQIYLRDVYDHTIQVVDNIETFRDMVTGMLDIYLSSLSNRMNEVMKVLTIIATIFIPLTFIAGIFGMNFKHMPELEWPASYPIVWGIMIAVAVVMIYYFKKKRWL